MSNDISKDMAKALIDRADAGVLAIVETNDPYVIGDVDPEQKLPDADTEVYSF